MLPLSHRSHIPAPLRPDIPLYVLTAYICADFALSFKAALDLRDVLVKMEKAKEEMLHIQKRLDVMIALTSEDFANRKEEMAESFKQKKQAWSEGIGTRMEDVKNSVGDKLENLKELTVTKPSGYLDSIKNELAELKEKYVKTSADSERLSGLRDFFQRDMIRSNPSMSSKRFKEALEELQRRANEKRKK